MNKPRNLSGLCSFHTAIHTATCWRVEPSEEQLSSSCSAEQQQLWAVAAAPCCQSLSACDCWQVDARSTLRRIQTGRGAVQANLEMQSNAFWGILWRNLCMCHSAKRAEKTKQNNNKKNKAGVQRVAESCSLNWLITQNKLAWKQSNAEERVKLQEQRRGRRQRSNVAKRKDEAVPGMSFAPTVKPSATQKNKSHRCKTGDCVRQWNGDGQRVGGLRMREKTTSQVTIPTGFNQPSPVWRGDSDEKVVGLVETGRKMKVLYVHS